MSILEIALIVLSGFATGILGALLGIGGGAFIIPILVLLFHVPLHFAIAASLLSVVATSSASSSVFLEKKLTNMRLGMTLEMFTTIGGIIGAFLAIIMSQKILQLIFSGMLIFTAIGLWERPEERVEKIRNKGLLGAEYYDEKFKREISYKVERLPLGFFMSFLAGIVSGMLGIGGGVIKVPTMVLGMKVPIKAANATSDMMIGVTAIASLYIYYAHHRLDLFISSSAALGTFLGSLLGAHLMTKIRSKGLIIIFSILLLLTSFEMIVRASGALQP
jgi:uncharacterized protein